MREVEGRGDAVDVDMEVNEGVDGGGSEEGEGGGS
jgi:hypothetical protein